MAFKEQQNISLVNDSDSSSQQGSDSSYDGTQYGLSCDTKPTVDLRKKSSNLGSELNPQYMVRPSNATITSLDEEDDSSSDESDDSDSDESDGITSPPDTASTLQNIEPVAYNPYNTMQQVQQANSAMMLTQHSNDNYGVNNSGFSVAALQQVQNQMRQAMSERFASAQYKPQLMVPQNYSADAAQPSAANNDNYHPKFAPSDYMQQVQQQSASVRHVNKSPQTQMVDIMRQQSQSARRVNHVSYQQPAEKGPPPPPVPMVQLQQKSVSERFVNQESAMRQVQQQSLSMRELNKTKKKKKKKKGKQPLSMETEKRRNNEPLYHQSPQKKPLSNSFDPPAESLLAKGNEIRIMIKGDADHKKYEKEKQKKEKCAACNVCCGIFGGIIAVLCVLAAFSFDEITKHHTKIGTFVCGHNSQYLCAGEIDECKTAFIFGCNFNFGDIGVESTKGVNMTQIMYFDDICESGLNEQSCTDIEAGNIFYYANIASVCVGFLGILLLMMRSTRKISSICYIIAALSAATAIGAYIVIAGNTMCWNAKNNEVALAASSLLDFVAFSLFLITSITMICINYIL